MMTIEAFKRAAMTKAGAWVASFVIAFLASAAAFGAKAFDMAVASTETVRRLEAKAGRTESAAEAMENTLKRFIAASASVNPDLAKALDRLSEAQDSVEAAEKRANERYNSLRR